MGGLRGADGSSLALSSLLIAAILVWAAFSAISSNREPRPSKAAPPPTKIARPDTPDSRNMARIALPPPPRASALAAPPPAPAARIDPPRQAMIVSPLRPKSGHAVSPPAPPPRKALAPVSPIKPTPQEPRSRPLPSDRQNSRKTDGNAVDVAVPTGETRIIAARADDPPGRALLRLLEHGSGPTVEIAWPSHADARDRLYRRLTTCHGMRAAIMDDAQRLFADGGAAKSPWKLNADRYSGFLRVPQGQPIAEEARIFSRLAAFHGLTNWHPVRVFPRVVDAALLGGLERLVGARYRTARTITAAYGLQSGALLLTGIVVDGQSVAGGVRLASRNCR